MGFAEGKVKEYILRHLSEFHGVRVDKLLDHLSCLTAADREEIRASVERKGNISSVHVLFERLWCRSGWVTELISVLQENDADLAEVIQQIYTAAQLPSERTRTARSRPAAKRHSPSPASVPVGPSAPSSGGPPLSPPRIRPRSTRAPLLPGGNASTPVSSASLQGDYRTPVQETKFASWSSEMATGAKVEAKVCGDDEKQTFSTPDQRNRIAAESDPSLAGQRGNPTDVQAAFPRSPVQHQTPHGEAQEDEMQSATPLPSGADAGNLARNWDGVQPRPVCVKNGYFGNMSRSVDSGIRPAPELAASPGLTASGNQPEENSYLFSDSSLLTLRGQDGVRAEEQKIQPLWGYQQNDRLDNPAINKPSPQMRVDEEQEGALGQQDITSKVNTVPLLQKGDRYSQQVDSRRVDFRAVPSDSSPAGSASANLPRRAATLPPPIPSETGTANCFGDSSSVGSEDVSQDHRLCHEATPGGGQLSEGNTVDLETRGPIDGWVWSPPSGSSGPSSTEVIPPSSPVAVSGTLSDGYGEVLKPPLQERELQGTDLRTPPEKMTRDVPSRVTVFQPSCVTDNPANSRANNASRPSRDPQIFCSNHEEEGTSLVKPGVLVSGEITRGPLDQHSSNGNAPYSGTSDRFRFSSDFSEASDPLMLSDLTRGSHSEDSGRNAPTATNGPSLRRRDDNYSDGDDTGTYVVRIEEPPSVDLTGAPEIARPALGSTSRPPGDFVDSVAGGQPIKNAGCRSACDDGRQNSCPDEVVTETALSYMSDFALLAVGFALVAVAFVLYKQLKK